MQSNEKMEGVSHANPTYFEAVDGSWAPSFYITMPANAGLSSVVILVQLRKLTPKFVPKRSQNLGEDLFEAVELGDCAECVVAKFDRGVLGVLVSDAPFVYVSLIWVLCSICIFQIREAAVPASKLEKER